MNQVQGMALLHCVASPAWRGSPRRRGSGRHSSPNSFLCIQKHLTPPPPPRNFFICHNILPYKRQSKPSLGSTSILATVSRPFSYRTRSPGSFLDERRNVGCSDSLILSFISSLVGLFFLSASVQEPPVMFIYL